MVRNSSYSDYSHGKPLLKFLMKERIIYLSLSYAVQTQSNHTKQSIKTHCSQNFQNPSTNNPIPPKHFYDSIQHFPTEINLFVFEY